LHAAIGAAEMVMGAVNQQGKLVNSQEWNHTLLIPTSPALEGLRGIGAVQGSVQILPLAGGEERCRQAAAAALAVARSEIRELVGSWPLDRREAP
jgi:hypothetical protein